MNVLQGNTACKVRAGTLRWDCGFQHNWSPLGAWVSPWQVCSEGAEGMSGGVGDKGKVRSGKRQGAFPCNLLAARLVVDLWTSSGEGR